MKLVLAAAAAASTLAIAPNALAQYSYSRSAPLADQAPSTRADTLLERADWLQARIQEDVDRGYLDRDDADRAIDRLQTIHDQQARLDDGSGLTVADADLVRGRIDRLEDQVRAEDPHSRLW